MRRLSLLLVSLLGLLSLACPAREKTPPPIDEAAARAEAVAVLEKALTGEDPALQMATAEYLLQLPAEVGEAATLQTAVVGLVNAEATGLENRQKVVDLLTEHPAWRALDTEARQAQLAWALGHRTSQTMEEREVAAYAIWKLGREELLADLVPLIVDPERTVRAIVAEAYGELGAGDEWSTIQRFIEDENEYVRLRAAKAIAMWTFRLGPDLDAEVAEEYLDELKADPDPFVQRMVTHARAIRLMNDPLLFRQEVYTPLLRGAMPARDSAEWEGFQAAALGRFEWSLGFDLPVPSEISRLVFEFLWDEAPDLATAILAAAARQPRPGESGFLQTAWTAGTAEQQIAVVNLLHQRLLETGEVEESLVELTRDIVNRDLLEMEPEFRTPIVRYLLALARTESLAAFDQAEVTAWKSAVADLYYSPRASVQELIRTLNPAHPWLATQASGRFAADATLRPHLPRLHRWIWFNEDPRLSDPAGGAPGETPQYPLTRDELDQLWRWGLTAPLPALVELLPEADDPLDLTAIRAAALILRGERPETVEGSGRRMEDWVDPDVPPLPLEAGPWGVGT